MHFFKYFYFRPVNHCIPYCNGKNLPPPEGKELQRPNGGFWKWHDQGNNLGGCRSCYNENCAIRIALTLPHYHTNKLPHCQTTHLLYPDLEVCNVDDHASAGVCLAGHGHLQHVVVAVAVRVVALPEQLQATVIIGPSRKGEDAMRRNRYIPETNILGSALLNSTLFP